MNLARHGDNFHCCFYFQTDMAQSSDSKENKNDSKENKNEHSEPQEQATNKPDQKDGKKEGSESPEEDMDIIVDYTDEETVKTLCSQVSDCSESSILCNRWL